MVVVVVVVVLLLFCCCCSVVVIVLLRVGVLTRPRPRLGEHSMCVMSSRTKFRVKRQCSEKLIKDMRIQTILKDEIAVTYVNISRWCEILYLQFHAPDQ